MAAPLLALGLLLPLASCKPKLLDDVEELALSASVACARSGRGTVHCWGRGFGGAAKLVAPLPKATRLVAVNESYCVTSEDKRVTCFGMVDNRLKIADLGWADIDRIAAGHFELCGLSGKTLRCRSAFSLLGGKAADDKTIPLDERPKSLAFMSNHLFLVSERGAMRSSRGPLSATNLLPDDAETVLTHDGDGMVCVRRKTGAVACVASFELPWGGERLELHNAKDVPALATVDEVAGGYAFVCTRTGGDVSCAGYNVVGQLGDGSTVRERPSLGKVALSGPARSVVTSVSKVMGAPGGGPVAMSSFACAVRTADRGVECWGDNADETLGDGSRTMRATPVRVRAR